MGQAELCLDITSLSEADLLGLSDAALLFLTKTLTHDPAVQRVLSAYRKRTAGLKVSAMAGLAESQYIAACARMRDALQSYVRARRAILQNEAIGHILAASDEDILSQARSAGRDSEAETAPLRQRITRMLQDISPPVPSDGPED
jgi:hypothetical protein